MNRRQPQGIDKFPLDLNLLPDEYPVTARKPINPAIEYPRSMAYTGGGFPPGIYPVSSGWTCFAGSIFRSSADSIIRLSAGSIFHLSAGSIFPLILNLLKDENCYWQRGLRKGDGYALRLLHHAPASARGQHC